MPIELDNLIMVTYLFAPSAASGTIRLLGFARHLPKFGWRTTVVAPPEMPWEPVDRDLLQRVPATTRIYETPYPRHASEVLRWAWPNGIWLPRAWSASRRALSETAPRAVLTSGPPHWVHTLGWYLKRWHGLPWVADFRDPWISDGKSQPTWEPSWPRFWERRDFKHADLILANAPQACACYQSAYPEYAHKVMTLTNGFDPENFPETLPKTDAILPLHVMHAGELYCGRNPAGFFDALNMLRAESGVHRFRTTFFGRTTGGGIDLAKETQARGLEASVQYGRQVAYRDSLQEMSSADILLLLDSRGRRIGVPAKLYEYMGTGRAILAMAEDYSDTALILRESGLPCRVVPLNDPVRIAQALRELAAEIVSPNATQPTLTKFTREHLTGQLANLLRERVLKQAQG